MLELWLMVYLHQQAFVIFIAPFPLKRVAGTADLGGLENCNSRFSAISYSFAAKLFPHQDGTKQGRKCIHSTWSFLAPWAVYPWELPPGLASPIFTTLCRLASAWNLFYARSFANIELWSFDHCGWELSRLSIPRMQRMFGFVLTPFLVGFFLCSKSIFHRLAPPRGHFLPLFTTTIRFRLRIRVGTRLFGLVDSVWPFRSEPFWSGRFGHGTFWSRDVAVRIWNLAEILHVHLFYANVLKSTKGWISKNYKHDPRSNS